MTSFSKYVTTSQSTFKIYSANKFSGYSDGPGISEQMADFKLLASRNLWDEWKAAQYLAMFLKGNAKAFYLQLLRADSGSYWNCYKHLKGQYEGSLACLKYI